MTDVSQPPPLPAVRRDAQARRDAGDLAGARNLLTAALEAGRAAYGKDHPEVLNTAHLLARLHQEADDPASARRVLEEALADGQRRWGDADPLLLTISFDLGTVAEALGNRHEARRNFTRVATTGPGVLGEDHWTVRAARDYLGLPQADEGTVALPAQPTTSPPAPAAPPISTPAPPPAPVPHPAPVPPPTRAPAPPPVPMAEPPTTPLVTVPAAEPPTRPLVTMPVSTPPRMPTPPPTAYPGNVYPPPTPGPQPYVTGPSGMVAPARPMSAPPLAPSNAQGSRGRNGMVIALVAIAAAVVAVVALVIVVVLRDRSTPLPPAEQTQPSATPSTAGDPPTGLRLRDDQSSITITWTDPTNGTVPFIVAGGQAGKNLGAMATLDAGVTSHTINGLNPRLDYCFTVLAVYSTDGYATSGQVCTSRSNSPG